jgi:hypothetical protein
VFWRLSIWLRRLLTDCGFYISGVIVASIRFISNGWHALTVLRPARDHAEKKTAQASEQERPDVVKRRQAWFDRQLDLDPDRLVFIDETWASTNMPRRYGRTPRGQRLRMSLPHGHVKTTTFIAGLRNTGMVAPFVIDGPVNREVFELYVEKVIGRLVDAFTPKECANYFTACGHDAD